MYEILFPSNKWVIDVTNENAIHLYDDFYSIKPTVSFTISKSS